MAKLRQLPLLLKAWCLLFFFRLSLWMLPFERVKTLAPMRFSRVESKANFRQIIQSVNRVSLFVPRATCLSRALTAKVLLAQSGYCVELCVGVAKHSKGHIQAQCLLEKDGLVVMNQLKELSSFVKFPS